ncbi:unnamed protein product, partial [marine sediment metagenome]
MPYNEEVAQKVLKWFPRYLHHTKGEWAGKKFKLLPWQNKIIKPLFGMLKKGSIKQYKDGTRRYNTVYIEIPKKQGKALAIDTPIPTIDGWKTIGKLKPKDQIFDENGQICNVIAVTNIMYNRPCYRVGFNDKSEIIADENHLWVTE